MYLSEARRGTFPKWNCEKKRKTMVHWQVLGTWIDIWWCYPKHPPRNNGLANAHYRSTKNYAPMMSECPRPPPPHVLSARFAIALWRLSNFHFTNLITDGDYIGCYAHGCLNFDYNLSASESVTPDSCTASCKHLGFPVASLSPGEEMFLLLSTNVSSQTSGRHELRHAMSGFNKNLWWLCCSLCV